MFGPYLTDGANTVGPVAQPRRARLATRSARYIIDNALLWLRDYHVDGLRLDAVHALVDRGAVHLLEAARRRGRRAVRPQLGRPLSLIAESDLNDPRLDHRRARRGGLRAARRSGTTTSTTRCTPLLTGERQGYYADFGSPGLPGAGAGTEAFFHAGTWSTFRQRVRTAGPVDRARIPGHRFVGLPAEPRPDRQPRHRRPASADAAARAAQGRRDAAAHRPRSRRCSSWARSGAPRRRGSSSPATRSPDLADGGARAAGARSSPSTAGPPGDVPDPQDPATFERSQLDWSEPTDPRTGCWRCTGR